MTDDRRAEARRILLVGGALGVVALAYLLALRHRTDYPGHFLAGYGATLGAVGLLVLTLPERARGAAFGPVVAAATLLCVAGGAGLEGSVFRLARFDPVDFFNQSLGAALAGLSVLVAAPTGRVPPATAAFGSLVSVAATAAGFFLAFR